jgi:O-glycosyl hydrolase
MAAVTANAFNYSLPAQSITTFVGTPQVRKQGFRVGIK